MRNIDDVTGISAYGEVPNLAALAIIHKCRIIVWTPVFGDWQRECIVPQGVLIEGEDIQLVFEDGHFEVLLFKEEIGCLEDFDSEAGAAGLQDDESDSSDSEDDAPKPTRKKQKTGKQCKSIFN